MLQAILNWTGGQPFLTRKVCQLICREMTDARIPMGDEAEARVVQTKIVDNRESKDEPQHMKYIRDRILHKGARQSSRLLGLYQQMLAEPFPANDDPESDRVLSCRADGQA